MVRECRFKNSFIFKYSERPGTKAAERLPDDVPEDVKRRRNHQLLALQDAISEEDNRSSSAARSKSWSRPRAKPRERAV
jgi:tRNA-2-methylthio-N6-dimethylallyladenosine synthase